MLSSHTLHIPASLARHTALHTAFHTCPHCFLPTWLHKASTSERCSSEWSAVGSHRFQGAAEAHVDGGGQRQQRLFTYHDTRRGKQDTCKGRRQALFRQ